MSDVQRKVQVEVQTSQVKVVRRLGLGVCFHLSYWVLGISRLWVASGVWHYCPLMILASAFHPEKGRPFHLKIRLQTRPLLLHLLHL